MTTGFILTRPIHTGAVSSPLGDFGIKRYSAVIPPSTTGIVDIIPIGTYASSKWLVTVINSVSLTMQSYEILADHLVGSTVTPVMVRYGSIGDRITNSPNVIFNIPTNSLILEITNNELEDITVHIARYELTDMLVSGVYGFGHKQIDTVVDDLDTVTVDSIAYSNYFSAKLLVTLVDSVNTLIDSYEIVVHYLDGKPSPTWNRTSQLSQTTITHNLDVTVSGGYINVNVTNTHGSPISVSVARYDTTQ